MIGTSFLRVAAHDDDYGSYAAITYSMSKEQPEYLQVNPVTGWVFVKQPISQVSPSPSPTAHPTSPRALSNNIYIHIQLACSSVLPSGASDAIFEQHHQVLVSQSVNQSATFTQFQTIKHINM